MPANKLARSVLVLLIMACGNSAWAVTYTVTSTGNNTSDPTTLAGAITAANSNPGSTIYLSLPSNSTITLTSALPTIEANMTINGGGAPGVTISGNNTNRVFFVDNGTVTIQNLTISQGSAVGGTGGSGSQGAGGGGLGAGGGLFVNSTANVTVAGVIFANNAAQGGAGGSANVSNAYSGGGGGGLSGNGGNGGYTAGGGGGGSTGNGGNGSGNTPGAGGTGGGGNGASQLNSGSSGSDFGGGGGGGNAGNGGSGGFGGGGGGSGEDTPGAGGFGAGNGSSYYISGNGGFGYGGAVFVRQGGTLTIDDTSISGSSATAAPQAPRDKAAPDLPAPRTVRGSTS